MSSAQYAEIGDDTMRKLLFTATALVALVAPSIANAESKLLGNEKYFGNYCALKERDGLSDFRKYPECTDMTLGRNVLVHNTVIGGWRCNYSDKDITAHKENPVLIINARCGPLNTKTTITIRKDDSKALINIVFDPPIPESLDQ